MLCFTVLLTIAIINYSFVDGAIPDYIKVCKRNDPEISKCVKNSILHLRKTLAKGIPELNVPGLEPLRIQRLDLQDNVNMNLTNLEIYGPSDFELVDISVDVEKNRFVFLYKFKELKFTGQYSIDMKILRIPLKSSGPLSGTFKNFQMTGKIQGKKQRNAQTGREHLVFRPFELRLFQGDSNFQLGNLFRGQQRALQAAADDIVNQNSAVFTKEILPALEKTLAEYFTLAANRMAMHFTYDELFPLD